MNKPLVMPDRKLVAIVSSRYEEVNSKLEEAIRLCGGLRIADGKPVVVKINLCDFRTPETGAITHPLFLDALLRFLRSNFRNLKIYVCESDATSSLPDLYVRWFGFDSLLRKWEAIWCNLSRQKTIVKSIGGRHFNSLKIPEIFTRSYFITTSKLKTHSLTKITCALKNQFGCMPTRRKVIFHPFLDDVIVDANLAIPPDFCIVDGIVGLGGGQGPSFGVPIHSRLIVAGADPVAVDTVCSKVMCLNPTLIGHVRKAEKSNVGSMKARVVGKTIGEVKTNYEFSMLEYAAMRIGRYLKSRSVLEASE